MIFDWFYDNVKPRLRLPISFLILFILMAIGNFLSGPIGQVVGLIIFYLLFLLKVRATP